MLAAMMPPTASPIECPVLPHTCATKSTTINLPRDRVGADDAVRGDMGRSRSLEVNRIMAPRLCPQRMKPDEQSSAYLSTLLARRAGPPREDQPRSVGNRSVDLHLGRPVGEAFLLAALAIGGEMRRLPMQVEGGVVLVLLVEDEDVGI